MMDYDIISNLKDYVGYSNWSDVLLNRGNFVAKITLTSPFCQSKIFNGRNFDCEFQKWKITRIMVCVCRVLSGCSIDSCHYLHLDLEQL
jgi:hypothetical protein